MNVEVVWKKVEEGGAGFSACRGHPLYRYQQIEAAAASVTRRGVCSCSAATTVDDDNRVEAFFGLYFLYRSSLS